MKRVLIIFFTLVSSLTLLATNYFQAILKLEKDAKKGIELLEKSAEQEMHSPSMYLVFVISKATV